MIIRIFVSLIKEIVDNPIALVKLIVTNPLIILLVLGFFIIQFLLCTRSNNILKKLIPEFVILVVIVISLIAIYNWGVWGNLFGFLMAVFIIYGGIPAGLAWAVYAISRRILRTKNM